MTKSPGIARLTRRRFATPRSAALVIVALTALVAFVVAAAPRALAGVIRDEVAYQVDQVAPTGRDLTGRMLVAPLPGAATDPAVVEGWDEGADAAFGAFGERLAEVVAGVDPALAPLLGEPEFAVYEVPIVAEPEELPATAPTGVVQLLADVRMRSEFEVVEGEWPAAYDGSGELEIVLARDAAETMAWPVGELRTMPGNLGPNDPPGEPVRLVGLVEAVDPDADRWQHLPNPLSAAIFDDGNRRPTATAAAYVDAAGWHDLPARLHYQPQTTAWIPLAADAAASQDPSALLAAMRSATAQSERMDDSGDARMRFSSSVVEVLATAVARSHAASSILTVAAVGPIAVSVALVVLAASLVVRRRRGDLALLAARGAPIGLLRRLLALEGLILGVPVAVAAAVAAVAVVPTDAGWLGTAIAALVGFVPAIALAGALRPASLAAGRADLDAPVRGRARRIVEGAVLLVAAIAVTLLVVRGIGPSTGGVDPLIVAAPLLATVALALIVVRLHPLPIAAVLRRATRGRGVVALVGAARTLRDPAAGTTAVLAMLVAVPVGLLSAIYLAEYSGPRFRNSVKPILEILAGIPTVVYGFFAVLTVAPAMRSFGASIGLDVAPNSALAAGGVMGIMIIPFISSLSDDALNAVPRSLRDGSYAMGATKAETIKQVLLPAALPGIMGGVLLALSRAIGETMIVVMAAGLIAKMNINPLDSVTTVTVQIVTLLIGDTEFDNPKTLAAFALGLVLFLVTLALNVVALRIVQKYREKYD